MSPPQGPARRDADRNAVGVYRGLQEAKLSIPWDVQVVAFNDSSIAQMLVPELSTLRLEAGVIGETSVDLLMERHAGRKAAKYVQITPTIIERGSTLKP
ncbi:substrate-binding domain-containing protein [Martelella mediterranea]|uniref:substrate-binding domain-containing protein n=1 Tax=Martelella mediterranea TaxID=293089 RepID=UPI001E30E9BA|nr:substrate-binding domain-containing protein [Martelella mediterranea]